MLRVLDLGRVHRQSGQRLATPDDQRLRQLPVVARDRPDRATRRRGAFGTYSATTLARPHTLSRTMGTSVAGTLLERAVSYSPMLSAHCASPLPDGSRFCVNCGADLEEPSSGATASLDDAGVVKLTRMLREETAGEYEIERELARGGMGVVYLATEIQLRRRVAIKVLPPTLTFGEAAIQRFRREARTAAALDHPNIIPIYR